MYTITKKRKNKILVLAFAAAWLYVLPILYQLLFINNDNPAKVIQQIEQHLYKQEQEYELLLNKPTALKQLLYHTYTLPQAKAYSMYLSSIQLYTAYNDSTYTLQYWNNNTVLPPNDALHYADGSFTITTSNGLYQYVKRTIHIDNSLCILTAMMPIHSAYFIETDYLKKQFAASAGIESKYTISTQPSIYAIKNGKHDVVCYIKQVNNVRPASNNVVYVYCNLAVLLLLIGLLYQVALWVLDNERPKVSFLVLLLCYIGIRLLTVYTHFPLDYAALAYFDPRVYGVNAVFNNLGNFTLNILLYTILLCYAVRYVLQHIKYTLAIRIIAFIAFVICSFYTVWLFRSLIFASKISFNVTNFFSLNSYSIIGFVHVAWLVVVYYYTCIKVFRVNEPLFQYTLGKYILVAMVGISILFFNFSWASELVCLLVLVWMLLFLYVVKYTEKYATQSIANYNIIWLIFFTVSSCLLFNYENYNKELAQRKYIAQRIAFQSDPATENLLSIALSRFDDYFLQKNIQKFYTDSTSRKFKEALLNENFVGYLNKFETKIYTYDSLELPLHNTDSTAYQSFNAIIQNQAKAITTEPNLYFYETDFDVFRYIFKKSIVDTSGKVLGYFIIQANPLSYKNKSAALSPELFKDRNTVIEDDGNNYVYAIYNNLQLRKRFMDYDMPTSILPTEIPQGDDTLKYRNGYQELWYKLNKNAVVVVAKKNTDIIATITLFAYLFFAFLVTIFICNLLAVLLTGRLTIAYVRNALSFNISKQVQVIVWGLSVLTFVIVGIVFISLFQSRFASNNKQRLSRTMGILLADVQNKLQDNALFEDEVKVYEPNANEALRQSVFQMSEIHNVDFNIYDLAGTLKLSSQPFIESKGIVSNKIEPIAYYYLTQKSSAQYLQQEHIGNFNYLSMYVPIRDEQGNAYGYLNIPYYSSQIDLKQEISNFLITIINLNAFIFLIAGLVAWLVTNRITNSFALIGSKMQAVNLGTNEIIQWNYNDEIGGLVKEYNTMVRKLEHSAKLLAKNEREDAWREMARQVAHEIKNPLTPMKLSVQFLQKSIQNGAHNVQELTQRVSATLVEQIDHLNTIAQDFSQFANIGNATMNPTDVLPIIQSLQQLFNTGNQVAISLTVQASNTLILADRTQINRLFTNLIQNAIQSYNANEAKLVHIQVYQQDAQLILTITDYGAGIPTAVQHNIFTPNFTTKSSGTGLGLAICKGIVEHARGTIQFTTLEGKGTTFTIQFPLHQ